MIVTATTTITFKLQFVLPAHMQQMTAGYVKMKTQLFTAIADQECNCYKLAQKYAQGEI